MTSSACCCFLCMCLLHLNGTELIVPTTQALESTEVSFLHFKARAMSLAYSSIKHLMQFSYYPGCKSANQWEVAVGMLQKLAISAVLLGSTLAFIIVISAHFSQSTNTGERCCGTNSSHSSANSIEIATTNPIYTQGKA